MVDPPLPKDNVGGRKKVRNPYLKKQRNDSAQGGSCYLNDNQDANGIVPQYQNVKGFESGGLLEKINSGTALSVSHCGMDASNHQAELQVTHLSTEKKRSDKPQNPYLKMSTHGIKTSQYSYESNHIAPTQDHYGTTTINMNNHYRTIPSTSENNIIRWDVDGLAMENTMAYNVNHQSQAIQSRENQLGEDGFVSGNGITCESTNQFASIGDHDHLQRGIDCHENGGYINDDSNGKQLARVGHENKIISDVGSHANEHSKSISLNRYEDLEHQCSKKSQRLPGAIVVGKNVDQLLNHHCTKEKSELENVNCCTNTGGENQKRKVQISNPYITSKKKKSQGNSSLAESNHGSISDRQYSTSLIGASVTKACVNVSNGEASHLSAPISMPVHLSTSTSALKPQNVNNENITVQSLEKTSSQSSTFVSATKANNLQAPGPIPHNHDQALLNYHPGTHEEEKHDPEKSNTTVDNICMKSSVKNVSRPTSNHFITRKELPQLPVELEYDMERIKPINDEHRKQLIKEADLSSPLRNGWKILPHQKAGIIRGLLMRRLVLSFDMGLGKTLIACVWAKAFKKTFEDLKIYVIAPASLKKEWRRTAMEATGLKCEEERKGKSSDKETKSYDLHICSWAKVPAKAPGSISNYIIIADEAHSMQNMESTRTKDTLGLALDERCKGILLLSGTPMKNGKPSNIFPLLRAAGHPFGDDQKKFEFFFCNGQMKRFSGQFVWDASGSSNLSLLNAHISSHVFHKTKEDCLKQLPPKKREFKHVPVSSRFQLQHRQYMSELARIQNSIDQMGNTVGQEALLGSFSRLRLVASLAKVDATVALAKSILEKEGSIVIFTYFVKVAKQVYKKLNELGWSGEFLAGETPVEKRQAMVDNFQAGISSCFVSTFGAGGVGITLTAARTIILLDRPWTPGDAMQAEDRVRRIGQTREVRSIWMRAFQVDEQIDKLIEQKMATATNVVDKRSNTKYDQSKSAPKISIRQLIQSVVENNISDCQM